MPIGELLFAEVLWWLGDRDEAKQCYREAQELKKRFNDRFWIDDLHNTFFAPRLQNGIDGLARKSNEFAQISLAESQWDQHAFTILDSVLVREFEERVCEAGRRTLSKEFLDARA